MDVPFDIPGENLNLDVVNETLADEERDQADLNASADQAECDDLDDPRIEEASSEYLVSWNRLISTTNWDKGRIIHEWREALVAVGAPASAYGDEAWSRRVGNVSPQHVGRLRRVFERFHPTYRDYNGLYWSHFQAALDWNDAEMWLEGAVQGQWSVAVMREKRWETLGAAADEQPADKDLVNAELDEDAAAYDDMPETISDTEDRVRPSRDDLDDESGEAEEFDPSGELAEAAPLKSAGAAESGVEPVRPFEDLPDLPDDLADAVEALKLAILHHKLGGWRDVQCDDVLATLSALKQLAMATE